jgi:hypothetical protein
VVNIIKFLKLPRKKQGNIWWNQKNYYINTNELTPERRVLLSSIRVIGIKNTPLIMSRVLL